MEVIEREIIHAFHAGWLIVPWRAGRAPPRSRPRRLARGLRRRCFRPARQHARRWPFGSARPSTGSRSLSLHRFPHQQRRAELHPQFATRTATRVTRTSKASGSRRIGPQTPLSSPARLLPTGETGRRTRGVSSHTPPNHSGKRRVIAIPSGQVGKASASTYILIRGYFCWRPRQDSNLRTRLRRPMLYPLSYEGGLSRRQVADG